MEELLAWTDIRGWLTIEEGMALQALARDKEVLEFGSFCGRSTVCMATVARKVTAVDHHLGDENVGDENTLDEFLSNLQYYGVETKVCPIILPISLAGELLKNTKQTFDMVFVDSAHDRASVKRDTQLALSLVRPGGAIAWHDWIEAGIPLGVRACGLEPNYFTGSLAWLHLPSLS